MRNKNAWPVEPGRATQSFWAHAVNGSPHWWILGFYYTIEGKGGGAIHGL